jgi:hypothetical protein
MAAATPQFGALTLAVTKAASLVATNVVVGVIDEFNRGRLYMPFTWGYTPQTGDAATKWLPQVGTVTAITDPTGAGQVGWYVVTLIPGTADQVNVASVQTLRVDSNALFITATGTF